MKNKEGRISVKVGESYGGDALVEALGGNTHDGLYAIGNDQFIVVGEDEGNDNYKVLAVIARRKNGDE